MTVADPWSGIPDDLRALVSQVGTQWFKTGYHGYGGHLISWSATEYTTYREAAEAAEAALCAALRALVADRERMDWIETEGVAIQQESRGYDVIWSVDEATLPHSEFWEGKTLREAIDTARGATPRGAQEDAE